ncbi:MAG: hypothetical protein FJY98_04780 [Candidatus Liptonbacteria bacterium]|nr:hypothetical protein [Candidatus Liptonbacteria bacterium]
MNFEKEFGAGSESVEDQYFKEKSVPAKIATSGNDRSFVVGPDGSTKVEGSNVPIIEFKEGVQTPGLEKEKILKDPVRSFLLAHGFEGDSKITYSVDNNGTKGRTFSNYDDLQKFLKRNPTPDTGKVPYRIDYDASVYEWADKLPKDKRARLLEDWDAFGQEGRTKEVVPGASVQWTSQGAQQWEKPKKVVSLSDDGEYAFFEDSKTGIPVSRLNVEVEESHEEKEVVLGEDKKLADTLSRSRTDSRYADKTTEELSEIIRQQNRERIREDTRSEVMERLKNWKVVKGTVGDVEVVGVSKSAKREMMQKDASDESEEKKEILENIAEVPQDSKSTEDLVRLEELRAELAHPEKASAKEASHEWKGEVPDNADGKSLIRFAKDNFGRFVRGVSKDEFEKMWSRDDEEHARKYFQQSIRTWVSEHPGQGKTYPDNIASLTRSNEERELLSRLAAMKGFSAVSLDEFERRSFSRVLRDCLGIDIEGVDENYYKHFSRR